MILSHRKESNSKPRHVEATDIERSHHGRPRKFFPFAVALLAVAGCHVFPASYPPLQAANESVSTTAEPVLQHMQAEDRAQLMYEIMIAELAGRRGYLDIATEGYRAASERTSDARVSERATKLAVYSRNWPLAIETGKRWQALAPENVEAFQILTQVFLRQGEAESAAEQMYALVELSDTPVTETVDQIYGTVARETDAATAIKAMGLLRDRLPNEMSTNLAYSRLALTQGEKKDALEAIDKAIELEPSNGEARLVRAQVLMTLGRGQEGLGDLEVAVKANPEDTNLHLGYARLLVDAERFDEAEIAFEEIFQKAPDDPQAMFTIGLLGLESKRNTAATRYFERLLELGEYEPEANFYLARIADSQQNYDVAIRHYENVTAGESFYDAQVRAAELYGITGQVEVARARIEELKQGSSEDFMPQLVRADARILSESGNVDEALEVLTAGLEQFPKHGSLLYTRALLAERHGKTEMFRSDLEILIQEEPENAHALNALGYHFADGNTNLEAARELLEKANRLLPHDPAILDSLGWLYYRLGNMEDALKFLQAAYDELEDPEIAGHLGEVLWVGGKQESAKKIWDKALAESPHDTKLKSVVERFIQ